MSPRFRGFAIIQLGKRQAGPYLPPLWLRIVPVGDISRETTSNRRLGHRCGRALFAGEGRFRTGSALQAPELRCVRPEQLEAERVDVLKHLLQATTTQYERGVVGFRDSLCRAPQSAAPAPRLDLAGTPKGWVGPVQGRITNYKRTLAHSCRESSSTRAGGHLDAARRGRGVSEYADSAGGTNR